MIGHHMIAQLLKTGIEKLDGQDQQHDADHRDIPGEGWCDQDSGGKRDQKKIDLVPERLLLAKRELNSAQRISRGECETVAQAAWRVARRAFVHAAPLRRSSASRILSLRATASSRFSRSPSTTSSGARAMKSAFDSLASTRL